MSSSNIKYSKGNSNESGLLQQRGEVHVVMLGSGLRVAPSLSPSATSDDNAVTSCTTALHSAPPSDAAPPLCFVRRCSAPPVTRSGRHPPRRHPLAPPCSASALLLCCHSSPAARPAIEREKRETSSSRRRISLATPPRSILPVARFCWPPLASLHRPERERRDREKWGESRGRSEDDMWGPRGSHHF